MAKSKIQRDREYRAKRKTDPVRAERARQYMRDYRKANGRKVPRDPEAARLYHNERVLKYTHGITLVERDAMLSAQGGRCAICETEISFGRQGLVPGAANVDHCHTTKKLRAILCGRCNTGLGSFRDSVWLLDRAKEYLGRYHGGEKV